MKNSLSLKKFYSAHRDLLSLVFPREESLKGVITCGVLQRPGLLLAGIREIFKKGALQFLGREEILYLSKLPEKSLDNTLEEFLSLAPPGVVLESSSLLPRIQGLFSSFSVPLFLCKAPGCFEKINQFLHWELSERITVHGELMGIYGLGVLISGRSGIGKSEIALELITRGHMFVADDMVEVLKLPGGKIVGRSPERSRGFMEIRGLGIINVNDIFGGALLPSSSIDLILELLPYDPGMERLFVEEESKNLLGVEIPTFKIPVAAGRNIANLVEVAVRLFLLKSSGKVPLEEFLKRLEEK